MGGPFPEPVRITGGPTFLPLGVNCTYDAVGDDIGPQTIHHHDFPATVGLIASVFAFGGGALILVRDWRPSAPARLSADGCVNGAPLRTSLGRRRR